MVHSADLMQALLALTDAPRKTLKEPEGGYTIGGFSFTPADLTNISQVVTGHVLLTVAAGYLQEEMERENSGATRHAMAGAVAGLRAGLGAQGSALEALAGRLASAQAESGGLRQQLEEVRASLPLVQGQNHELNLFRREMREQSDAFRVEVSRSVGT